MIATRTIPTHNVLPHRSPARGILIALGLSAGFWAVAAAAVVIATGGLA